jgi:hypothetical protein
MPISYRIDPQRNLVLTTASGALGDADILELKRALRSDPRVSANMRQLSDVRLVTDLRVTPAGVRQMVAADVDQGTPPPEYRLAIVTGQDVVFGMARMYQTLTDASRQHVGVFRSLEEAEAWLSAD